MVVPAGMFRFLQTPQSCLFIHAFIHFCLRDATTEKSLGKIYSHFFFKGKEE